MISSRGSSRRLGGCRRSGGIFDCDAARSALEDLRSKSAEPDFWSDQAAAQDTNRKIKGFEKTLETDAKAAETAEELGVFLEFLREGEAVDAEAEAAFAKATVYADDLELSLKMTAPEDPANAWFTIHSGAGGTESQDWAEMLLRMYMRFCERRGWKAELIERVDGEEAGLKSATLHVVGDHAYGYLKGEMGVHRLVRISPFDANKRRHTSFASVFVTPEIEDDIEIVIPDKDIRVDTYRSSGAGGQHVNVTDSAVRITHLPTNIVVTCQNERSQGRNRDVAMKVLRAKLYQKAVEERRAEEEKRAGTKKKIEWGSQIRSYVLHPYQLVKDHRTDTEVGDTARVLDGDLTPFIDAYLKDSAAEKRAEG
jgi:peptide chain release factor 2